MGVNGTYVLFYTIRVILPSFYAPFVRCPCSLAPKTVLLCVNCFSKTLMSGLHSSFQAASTALPGTSRVVLAHGGLAFQMLCE